MEMSDLPRPTISISDVIRDCASNYRDQGKKKRFEDSIPCIEEYTLEFETKVATCCVDSLNDSIVNSAVSKEEMKKLYTEKLSKTKQPGRIYYDKLISSVPQSICPYCMVRPVESLDHYLVKNHYSYLSVSPTNLIPCCLSCNKEKGEALFDQAERAHIHPYFDETSNETWLSARIESYDDDYSIQYQVVQPDDWDDLTFARMKNHFILFRLSKLYKIYAIDDIESSMKTFQSLKRSSGVAGLKKHLQDTCESVRYYRKNHWKAALYQALSESNWFVCDYVTTDS